MSVRKEYRRRGIADLLMNQAIVHSSESGMSKLFLQLTPVQKSALRLYTKRGFKRTKILSKYIYGLLNVAIQELELQLRQ